MNQNRRKEGNKRIKIKKERHTATLSKMHLFGDIGEQSHNSCSLDSHSQFSLMLCANAGGSSGSNLAAFRDKLSELCYIFIIDAGCLFGTKCAKFSSDPSHSRTSLRSFFHSFSPLLIEQNIRTVTLRRLPGYPPFQKRISPLPCWRALSEPELRARYNCRHWNIPENFRLRRVWPGIPRHRPESR